MTDGLFRPVGKWALHLSPDALTVLRGSEELHLALLLARMIDSLRFGIAAAWQCRDDPSAMADQQRYSLIFHLAATLNEIEDWRKGHSHEIAAFPPFARAFGAMDAIAVEPAIRAAMGRLRNKIVAHFDSTPFQEVVSNLPSERLTFAEGRGGKLLSDSNDLANATVAFFAHDIGTDFGRLNERTMALLDAVLARANAFAQAGRDSLHLHLVARGGVFVELQDEPAAV